MSFGEKDGEEFDQVKVALVPVIELHCQMSSASVDTSWSVTTGRRTSFGRVVRRDGESVGMEGIGRLLVTLPSP
jgi:hypothetical protein